MVSFNDANGPGLITGEAQVVVLDAPQADFQSYPDSMSVLYTTTKIKDRSVGNIVSWEWDFGEINNPIQYIPNPTYTYKDSVGSYEITLIVSNMEGCWDTTSNFVSIYDDYWIYIPNSFTPDLDGKNDEFCISYHGIRESTFIFNVYNRFSELVYFTDNINDLECPKDLLIGPGGWNGQHISTGNDLPTGSYIYEIYYQDFEGWKHHDRGHIFIVR